MLYIYVVDGSRGRTIAADVIVIEDDDDSPKSPCTPRPPPPRRPAEASFLSAPPTPRVQVDVEAAAGGGRRGQKRTVAQNDAFAAGIPPVRCFFLV